MEWSREKERNSSTAENMPIQLRRHYKTGSTRNQDPLVCVVEDFVKDQEIEHLVEAAKPQLRKALVSAAKSGVESAGRSGQNCWIPHSQTTVIQSLAARVSNVVGIPLMHAENFQVIHYAQTQQYAPHYDAWDESTERGQRCMAKKGQRLVTVLLYLNEPARGGGTCFPKLNMVVEAKKGRMVIFHNCRDGTTRRHVDSLHGGMPVEAGEKWAVNLWFREKQCQGLMNTVPKSTLRMKHKNRDNNKPKRESNQ